MTEAEIGWKHLVRLFLCFIICIIIAFTIVELMHIAVTKVNEAEDRNTAVLSAMNATCIDAGGEYISRNRPDFNSWQIVCGINGSIVKYVTYDDGRMAWRDD